MKKTSADWTETSEGTERYRLARAKAQADANRDGMDRGLCRDDVYKNFNVIMLPRREFRRGHELRCEVVSCEDLSRRMPGHGPQGMGVPPQTPAVLGYPPHDYTMMVYRTGAERAKCWAPLQPPENAGVMLVEVCVCGKDEAAHSANKACSIGYRPAAGCLYCPQCKVFLVAGEEQIERARLASIGDVPPIATLAPPPEPKRRVKLDPSMATLNLFTEPQYHAKLGPVGRAR